MNSEITYSHNTASETDVFRHLSKCNLDFIPALSERVDVQEYSQKLYKKAERFEAWKAGVLVGLLATYCNDSKPSSTAYITSVSIELNSRGEGIGESLLKQCIAYVIPKGFRAITLEVGKENHSAIGLYKKFGFKQFSVNDTNLSMKLELEKND